MNILCNDPRAILLVKEAYKHAKPIAKVADGAMLITKAGASSGATEGIFSDIGITTFSGEHVDTKFIEEFLSLIAMHRFNEPPDLML